MGYSAEVDLQLRIAGQTYDVAQTGPDWLRFREPVTLPHQEGELLIIVDGVERSYAVWVYGCENARRVQCKALGTDKALRTEGE